MKNFEYYAPTKVFFGKGNEEKIGEIIKSYGYKKVISLSPQIFQVYLLQPSFCPALLQRFLLL